MIGCPCHGPAIGGSWPIFLPPPPVLLPFGPGFFFIHNIRPGAGYENVLWPNGPEDAGYGEHRGSGLERFLPEVGACSVEDAHEQLGGGAVALSTADWPVCLDQP